MPQPARDPEVILRWAARRFSPDLALATSFGPQTIVLMHMLYEMRAGATIFYLDTGLLFPETYALRDRLAERFGIEFTAVRAELSLEQQAGQYGPRLWESDPDRCCHLRKVAPLQQFLATQRAWITGLRRKQNRGRAHTRSIERDRVNGLIKINPLVEWDGARVWAYLREHELPFNPLHLLDFRSIGCLPCTRVVRSGDDSRAGRWPGREKTECGIHSRPEATP